MAEVVIRFVLDLGCALDSNSNWEFGNRPAEAQPTLSGGIFWLKFRGKVKQSEIQLAMHCSFRTKFLQLFCLTLQRWFWIIFHAWLRLSRRLGDILFVPAKSMQKPREQKNSSGDLFPTEHWLLQFFMLMIFYLSYVEWFENHAAVPSDSFCSHSLEYKCNWLSAPPLKSKLVKISEIPVIRVICDSDKLPIAFQPKSFNHKNQINSTCRGRHRSDKN